MADTITGEIGRSKLIEISHVSLLVAYTIIDETTWSKVSELVMFHF